jgi:hypothetical protein
MQISTCAFTLLEAVEDRPQVQVVGLDVAEVALDVFEVLRPPAHHRPGRPARTPH